MVELTVFGTILITAIAISLGLYLMDKIFNKKSY
jgi:hypothetical protein